MRFSTLEHLRDRGILSDIDVELALTLGEMMEETRDEVLLGAAFASWAVQQGHTCADLRRLVQRRWEDSAATPIDDVTLPEAEAWIDCLRGSTLVAIGAPDEADPRPLVLDSPSGLVTLHRYAMYERDLGRALAARADGRVDGIDDVRLRDGLARLFAGANESDRQRAAAALAVLRRFAVICGGPGTGKTYTVAKVLLLLMEQANAAGEALEILLVAPTGKAAQRLGEAIRQNLEALGVDAGTSGIPTTASTIHRALGWQPRTPTRFRHHAENPLRADVVVVDEASMVDLALMTKLVDAVAPSARLLLLGDKDQLASVEAGAVLADICGGREDGAAVRGVSEAFAREVQARAGVSLEIGEERGSGLQDAVVELVESRRFAGGSEIGQLAEAINAGDADRALGILRGGADVRLEAIEQGALDEVIGGLAVERLKGLRAKEAAEKLAVLAGFRILCCHRRGPFGVETLNALVEDRLRREGVLGQGEGEIWYAGRPVIVTENDYSMGLFNGDVGVLGAAEGVGEDGGDGREAGLMAWFPDVEPGKLRAVALGRLPPHETVFAMSVHKSQGSEFDEVAVLLPERVSPIVTRELLYTAVTRARKRVRVFAAEEVVRGAIAARVERWSVVGGLV